VSEQYNTFDAVWEEFAFGIVHEFVGSIGGSPSKTWYITGGSQNVGANPFVGITFATVPAEHTATVAIRFNPALLGTLDPAIPYGVQTEFPQFVLSAMTYAEGQTWISRAGGIVAWRGSVMPTLATAIMALAAQPSGLAVTVRSFSYTDGARAGAALGWAFTATYDPTAAELTAGIRELQVSRYGAWSDVLDGTVNIVSDGGTIGEATLQVPVVVFESTPASQAWTNFVNQQVSLYQDFSVTSFQIITNEGDLGAVDHPSREPVPPGDTTVEVFASPGVLPAVVAGTLPAIQTTFPGQLLVMMALASQAIQAGLPVVTAAAAKAIEIANAPGRIAAALESLVTSVASIATDLSAIRPAILPPDPEALPAGSLVDQLKTLRDTVQVAADTRNVLHLKAHGYEVQAESGAVIEDP
jgi:hypothetical protein